MAIVTDPYAPTISDIGMTPANPTPNDRVTVRARIKGPSSGLKQVSLYYSVNDGPSIAVEMARTPQAEIYEGTIPLNPDHLHLFIESSQGNSCL